MVSPKRPGDPARVGAAWMVAWSLLLFFLPTVNGLVGGIIGGYRVGSSSRAGSVAIAPALWVALGMWILLMVFSLLRGDSVSFLALGVVSAVSGLGVIVGAFMGGVVAEVRDSPRLPT
ncbi:hypothetical protein JGU66_08700 [Myxococcaceae bacterium JPH2]|nr:hypothetical protein [Myxococcaceae bacterium JPH2]